MALRLDDLVVGGEIFNTTKNTVHGYIGLRDQEQPLVLNLTGNCDPDLAGRHIRFEARPNPMRDPDAGPPDIDLSKLAWQQVGPAGTMTAARKVKIADCPPKEFYIRTNLNEPPPVRWVRCLYLEWYSQNGRVVIELPNPIIEFLERVELDGVPMTDEEPDLEAPEDEEAPKSGLGITALRVTDDGDAEIQHQVLKPEDEEEEEDVPPDDPFGLVPDDLQRMLDKQAAETDQAIGADDTSECIREMELLDDLIDHGEDEPICNIFEQPMRLARPEDLDDEQVKVAFHTVLGQLALAGIALDMCEHFTPRDAYQLLLDKILFEERVFPQLRGTQWVTHFMTSEFCKECEAKWEREFEEKERKRELDAGEKGPDDADESEEERPF